MESQDNPRVNLIVLRSTHQERLRDFYQNILDVQFEQHTDHGPMHYGANIGNVYFEIYPSKEATHQKDSIGFSVHGLDSIIEKTGRQYLHRPPQLSQFGRSAILKDPDGRLVHLTEEK